jgi:hypothetical protein
LVTALFVALVNLHKPLHFLRIIPDLAVYLILVQINQAEAILEGIFVITIHEILLVFYIKGKLMIETYRSIVNLHKIDAFFGDYVDTLILVLHSFE